MLPKNRFGLISSILCILLVLLLTPLFIYANHWGNARDYEPITIKGEEFASFIGESIFDISAYKYNADDDEWIQVSIQIDEKDDSTHFWIPNKNNVLNENDVVVFMAKDMGDQVPVSWYWIDNEESRENERYEIVATDPNNGGSGGYLYFYLSSTIPDTSDGYMDYTEAPVGTGADSIHGITYVEGHTDVGYVNCWKVPQTAGGSGVDMIDRQKARLSGSPFGLAISMTENDLTFSKLDVVVGKVRIAKRVTFIAWLLGGFIQIPFDFITYYYPYSVDARGASTTLSSDYNINHIRQSFDLVSAASGMMFYSNNNDSILIDGAADDVATDLVFLPSVNYFLVTGNHGTILYLLGLSPLGTTQLYYHDNSSGGSADGKADTGDGQSWGDLGVVITGSKLEGSFSIAFKNYFLPGNQAAAIGPEFALNFENPLSVYQNSQFVPVELASFYATATTSTVLLDWTTESETNNYGFEIQRRTDAASEWLSLGFVKGNGTTATPQHYHFVDQEIKESTYEYRLKQIDFDGSFEYSQTIQVNIGTIAAFDLKPNYPNPFNAETKIQFNLPEKGKIVAKVYNIYGEEVITLFNNDLDAGAQTLGWNGIDNNGREVTSGIYLLRIQYANKQGVRHIISQRMTLVK